MDFGFPLAVAGFFRGTKAGVEDEGRFRFFEPVAKKGSGIPFQLTGSSEVGGNLQFCLVDRETRVGPVDGKFPHFQRSFHVHVNVNKPPCTRVSIPHLVLAITRRLQLRFPGLIMNNASAEHDVPRTQLTRVSIR